MDDCATAPADGPTMDAWGEGPIPNVGLATLSAGQAIGRYLVLERIGTGGMGVVYAAYDPELDRKVAVKLLLRDRDEAPDDEAQARLMREAQAMAQLNHPNVIGVHDVGEHAGAVFVAMEFVDGRTLGEAVDEEPDDHRRTIRLFIAAGQGLAAAHAAGLVHRDFKPDNVLAGHDGRVRVLDFGLARPARLESPVPADEVDTASLSGSSHRLSDRLTQTGRVIGTPAYMAPEQFAGGQVDARTDQFAFCVALWEALDGRRPFSGDSYAELATAVTEGRLDEAASGRSMPPHVRRALRRGLQRDPGARFPTMGALLAELERDPSARRQRWIAAVLGGGALFGLGLAVTAWDRASPEVCPAPDRALADAWSDEHAARVEAAFVATGLPYARTVYDDLRGRLDTYAADWRAAYVDNCEATRVRSEQSAELFDLRQRCLNRRRDALARLVEHLERADAKVIDGAAMAEGELPGLETCSDPQRVRLVLPETRDLERESEAERLIDFARIDKRLAGAAEAIAAAEQALAIARELEHLPLQAQALGQLASANDDGGNYEAAERAGREGVWLAYRAGDHETVVDIATTLVLVVGIRLARQAEAEVFAELGLAAIERAGGSARRAPYLHSQVGMLKLQMGHDESARAHFDQAITRLEEQGGDATAPLASIASNTALAYYQRGDFDRAHAEYIDALHRFEGMYGPEHPNVAAALHNLAMTTAARLDIDGAIAHMRRAVEIRRELLGEDHPETCNSLSNLGALLRTRGDLAEAREVLESAIASLQRSAGPDNPQLAVAHGNLAEVLRAAGDLEGAQRLFETSIVGMEKVLGREHPYLAYPLAGLGLTHLDAGRIDAARDELERALGLDLSTIPDDELLGSARFGLARVLRAQGLEPARATALANEARGHFAKLQRADDVATVDAFLAATP